MGGMMTNSLKRMQALGRLKTGQMNRTEQACANHLEVLLRGGEIKWFRFEGIKLRLANKLQTFISTNLSLKEIKEKYHERFLSRLKELTMIFELKGADYRSKIIQEKYKNLNNTTDKKKDEKK